jgi:glutamate carboxypeptidase
MMQSLLDWCEAESRWVREAVDALVRLEPPTTATAAVARGGAARGPRLGAIGGRVTRIEQAERGDHIRAAFGSGRKQVLILGHIDTVWDVGQLERMPLTEQAGRLHGPGIFDMKAGIAVAMLAVRALQERAGSAWPRLVLLWTTDEEVGSGTSRRVIEEEARSSDAVLVLEPSLPGGAAKTSRKGCGEFELIVHGESAHAGVDPDKGASAVLELAHQILDIASIQDLERGVSVNVGVITGGTRPNVVPHHARASIDVRVPTVDEAARVEQALRRLRPKTPGTWLEIHGAVERPPLERSAAVLRLYGMARDVARALGQDLAEGGTGGGSDGNFTAALGVPTLDGLGPRGAGAHAIHEHVELADLPWRAAFLAALLVRLEEVE